MDDETLESDIIAGDLVESINLFSGVTGMTVACSLFILAALNASPSVVAGLVSDDDGDEVDISFEIFASGLSEDFGDTTAGFFHFATLLD